MFLLVPEDALVPLGFDEIGGTGDQQQHKEMDFLKRRDHILQRGTFVGLLCTWKLYLEPVSFVWLCNFISKNDVLCMYLH
jgi:hypothetical protein